jgi:hypothetical protein
MNQSGMKEWSKPVLEVLEINQTMAGKSPKSQDGGQGGDSSNGS